MSSKTRIVVLHMKEVIYTAIFLLLGLLMIILLLIMFGPSKDKETASSVQTTSALTGQYLPGVYSTAIELNDNTFDVQVTVDSNHINSIELVNLSESTAAMYPLMDQHSKNSPPRFMKNSLWKISPTKTITNILPCCF